MARHTRCGRGRHVDVPDAEVGDARRSRRSARPGSSRSCRPRRFPWRPTGCRWSGVSIVDQLEARQLGGRHDRVVGERGGQRVAVVVVDDLLEQRLRGALGEAAVALPLGEQRVEDRAGVVDGDQPLQRRPCRYSVSTSTTATCAPNGNVAPGRGEHRRAPAARSSPASSAKRDRRCRARPRRRSRPGRVSTTRSSGSASSTVGGALLGHLDQLDAPPAGPRRRPAAGCASRRCRRPRGPGRCRPT